MRIEIDQSGKIEQTDMDTVIAFSNSHQYSILLPKELKRKLINRYRQEKQIFLKLFVICVYYTLRDYLHQVGLIIIDNEYEGKQNYIKSLLLDFIRKDYKDFDKNLIRIGHITKKSKAHAAAANVQRGFAKPQKTLSEKDMEKLIQGALSSRPASTAFSAKLRHGLAWHPSSTLTNIIFHYIKVSVRRYCFMEKSKFRVKAKPPFLHLKPGFDLALGKVLLPESAQPRHQCLKRLTNIKLSSENETK